jgi:hypothetical protein
VLLTYIQTQNINFSQNNIKAIEARIKAEEYGLKSRESVEKSVQDGFSVIKQTNDDLRAELGRIKDQQKDLSESVNKAISIGLSDIRNRLEDISVSNVLEEIPGEFKDTLRDEIRIALVGGQSELSKIVDETTEHFKIRARKEIFNILAEIFTNDSLAPFF